MSQPVPICCDFAIELQLSPDLMVYGFPAHVGVDDGELGVVGMPGSVVVVRGILETWQLEVLEV